MSENRKHSTKNDILVGVGGLILAFGASLPHCRYAFLDKDSKSDNKDPLHVLVGEGPEGPQLPYCDIDKLNQDASCTLDMDPECKVWAEQEALNISPINEVEVPEICKPMNISVEYRLN